MKPSFNFNATLKKYFLIIAVFFFQGLAWAQDKKVDVDISVGKKESDWYQQPWVWVVGGAIFLLILVGLLKGGGKKE
ncbi:MAG: hypothetical protein E6H07_19415 [Bacteroidetes bacterium]|nr:MAG: hypothetical protein E6H07_19415 [Bacteroidota bacterium]